MSRLCPLCPNVPMKRDDAWAGDCWVCAKCGVGGTAAVLDTVARLGTPEHAMELVESLLRERSVYEVAFTEATFSGPEKRTYLEVKPVVGRSFMGATLIEAWRKLTGKGG